MTHENNIGGGAEHPGSDEQKISEMLTGLNRVEAPKDFDFHLKARIANARPADYQRTSLFPILKYAMPLALFLVVGAGVILNGSYNSWQTPEVTVQSMPETPVSPVRESTPSLPTTEIAAATPVPSPDVKTFEKDEAPRKVSRGEQTASRSVDSHSDRTPVKRDLPSNSTDRALRGSGDPLTPIKTFKAKDALKMIGIDAEFENDNWTVKAVKANEAAGHLGVKPGDRIKTIDGKRIDEKSEFKGGIKVSRIQVQRGDSTIDLSSQNKPE